MRETIRDADRTEPGRSQNIPKASCVKRLPWVEGAVFSHQQTTGNLCLHYVWNAAEGSLPLPSAAFQRDEPEVARRPEELQELFLPYRSGEVSATSGEEI